MSKGPIVTGIGNAAEAKVAARLEAEMASRWWRCDCGAMAQGPECVKGHPAPWRSLGKPQGIEPERVRGMVTKSKAGTPPREVVVTESGIKVEKGIPMPPRGSRTQYPWADMSVGDSFFVPCEGDALKVKKFGSSIATSGRAWLRRNGVPEARTAHRAVAGGVRVWRVA